MKTNMGTTDQVIRSVAAVLVIVLYLANVISGTPAIVLLVIAGIFIATSFMSFCPLYWPLGISTRKRKSTTTNP